MVFLLDGVLHLLYCVFAPLQKNFITVDVSAQRLTLYRYGTAIAQYVISTAKKGTGEGINSYQTPRGWLRICACHGDGQPLDMQFRARQPVGRLKDVPVSQDQDPILARVLRLSGLQWLNRHTYNRYVYNHGARQSRLEQHRPLSQGCVNMSVQDVTSLYEKIEKGAWVYIIDVKNCLLWQPCFFNT